MKSKEQFKEVPDAQLIADCLKGKAGAWEALVKQYKRLVYSIPIRYGFTEDDAADIFQQVCVLLLENLGRLRDPSKIGFWLITTTRRECWRYKNSRLPETTFGDVEEDDPLAQIPDPSLPPDEMAILWQQQHLLRQAVERLPERQRRLIHYLFYEPLSYDQIAERLAMPVASIGPTRQRALEKLKRILKTLDSARVFEEPTGGSHLVEAYRAGHWQTVGQ
jgi:RNA polymerase sigma factor (sigma-70 family)